MSGTKGLRAAATVALLVLFGCAGGYSNQDRLRQRVDRFNDDIRWGRYFSAAEFVHTDTREEWVTEHRSWRNDDLRIADYEVIDSTEGEDGTTTIRVVISWYRLSVSEVQTTMFAQSWRRFGRVWQLVGEEVEEGTPL